MHQPRTLLHGFFALVLTTILMVGTVSAQPQPTAIGSVWSHYYEALALRGDLERPYLTIQQLSRNVWDVPARVTHPWQQHEPTPPAGGNHSIFSLHSLGAESYSTFNSRYATGGNDGSMWQGRGFNTRFQGGGIAAVDLNQHRIGMTLFPEFWAAENRAFELVSADDITGTTVLFADQTYGYITRNMDLPQRFGSDPLVEFGWGETEMRYDYQRLSIGFGNQALWLGPGRENALILSNNAGGFPKIDIGIRKTELRFGDIEIGAFEGLAFWGRLTPSEFFDTVRYDTHNFYSGLALGYSPSFWRDFTVGFNKVAITQWSQIDGTAFIQPFNPEFKGYRGEGGQQASLTGDFFSTASGTNIYVEWGRWDFSGDRNLYNVPGWASAFTIGGRQIFGIDPRRFMLLSVEFTDLGKSRAQMLVPAERWNNVGFYQQQNVGTGFTHRGQVLGGAIGPGGDSQNLAIAYYGRLGYVDLFINRIARNKDVLYFTGINTTIDDIVYNVGPESDARQRMFVEVRYGLSGQLFVGDFGLGARFTLHETRNWNYRAFEDVWNARVELNISYLPRSLLSGRPVALPK